MSASATQTSSRTISVPSVTTRTPSGRFGLVVVAGFGLVALAVVAPGVALFSALVGSLGLIVTADTFPQRTR